MTRAEVEVNARFRADEEGHGQRRRAGREGQGVLIRPITVALFVIVACSPPRAELGPLTDDGVAAFKQLCGGKLEASSKPSLSGVIPVHNHHLQEATDLLNLYCTRNEDGHFEIVSFHADNQKLLNLDLSLVPSMFDSAVDRILLPTLDHGLREQYARMRAWLDTPDKTVNQWSGRGVINGRHPGHLASERVERAWCIS